MYMAALFSEGTGTLPQEPCKAMHMCLPRVCLQVAAGAAMGPQQLEASCALGLLYESQAQPGLAMACHERCLQLSNELQRPDDAATAYAQLVQVCKQGPSHVQAGILCPFTFSIKVQCTNIGAVATHDLAAGSAVLFCQAQS
jgi:hypothetical protein